MGVKNCCFLLILAIGLLLFPNTALGVDSQSLIAEQYEQLELDELKNYLDRLDKDIQKELSSISLSKILEDVRNGELDLDIFSIFNAVIRYFFREFLTHTSLLGKLIVLGALLAILEHLQNAFEQNTVAKIAHSVGMLALFTVALSSFTIALQTGREAITNMVGFMQSLIPVVMTLMAAMGNLSTVALMHPVIYVSLNILATLTQNIVFPLIFCAAVLGIVSNLSTRFQVSRLANLFKDGSMVLIGLFLTVFIGILSIQGVAGAVTDGVGLRTAKFLTGAFVPVVGGMLTDAVDAIAGCSLFIKNTIGVFGVLAIVILCALPVIKILSAAVMYRLAAALLQPLGAQQLGDCLDVLGNNLFLVFGAVVAVGLMLFFSLAIMVGLSNAVVMLR
ncbi:MAG TPA: stage III sporulation protein AE [Syntrophaceticus sp.]|nr:stage III sporulation protein AE [Syntrophaceticus sp.]